MLLFLIEIRSHFFLSSVGGELTGFLLLGYSKVWSTGLFEIYSKGCIETLQITGFEFVPFEREEIWS